MYLENEREVLGAAVLAAVAIQQPIEHQELLRDNNIEANMDDEEEEEEKRGKQLHAALCCTSYEPGDELLIVGYSIAGLRLQGPVHLVLHM